MAPLTLSSLQQQYASGTLSPRALIHSLQARFKQIGDDAIFIHWLSESELESYLQKLECVNPNSLPLYGIPFAIKDNIDLAGIPTTAACPDYSYIPERSAFVVQKLLDAGAIPVGKTNMDQFATGLVGVRSPYGIPRNPLTPDRIPGGSSSGSAVAVAQGLALFSLGTDTAGSGRIPAAFNELIGVKPSCGILSSSGVVPACRSLDCVSIFANTLEDAHILLRVSVGYDAADAYSRQYLPLQQTVSEKLRIGIPRVQDLEFFADEDYSEKFQGYLESIRTHPEITLVEIDFTPFRMAASLLYQGPWIAERYAAVGDFLESHPDSIHPVTRSIIVSGNKPSAIDAFKAFYQLEDLKRAAGRQLAKVDCILTPTAGHHFTLGEVAKDPFTTNTELGYYTNFMNLLDYSALAIPAGRTKQNLPFGITIFTEAMGDEILFSIANLLSGNPTAKRETGDDYLQIAVCGAHMRGMALNPQLLDLGAEFVKEVNSAPNYQFLCLQYKQPIRPGMVRVEKRGVSVEMEIWNIPISKVGKFLSMIGEPLGLGSVELEDGSWVKGFICEGHASAKARDISEYGSWRKYLASR